jgi:NADH-quinone oxidoreductase subunit J
VALPETVPYLDWRWDDLIFLVLAGILLGAALLVVLGRDVIRSGLWLILCFAGLAGIYALLGSPFMAAAQVLVYMGAISVLILFAIMITQSKAGPARLVFQRQWWAGGLAAIGLVLLMLVAVLLTAWPQAGEKIVPQEARQIALLLFDENLFAFEAIGVLLLAAVIGGLYLARREVEPNPAARGGPTAAGDDEAEAL